MFFRLLISKLCVYYLFSNNRKTTLLVEKEPSPSATSVVRRGVVSILMLKKLKNFLHLEIYPYLQKTFQENLHIVLRIQIKALLLPIIEIVEKNGKMAQIMVSNLLITLLLMVNGMLTVALKILTLL